MSDPEKMSIGERPLVERERKFIVPGVIDCELNSREIVSIGYIASADVQYEERAERIYDQSRGQAAFKHVERIYSGNNWVEIESPINVDEFEEMWQTTDEGTIKKTVVLVPYEGVCINYNVYRDELKNLRIATVKFIDQKDADAFVPPDWFGDDITGNLDYEERALAESGIPIRAPSE